MINFGPFEFAGAPRAGTTWILGATALAGLGEYSKSKVHVPHVATTKERPSKTLRVSMVRNPCDWLVSYYGAIGGGHTNVPEVDALAPLAKGTHSFQEFIESYLAEMPGQVGRMFLSYNADTYIRVEDLPWAYAELCVSVGVEESKARRMNEFTRQNAGRFLAILDRRTKKRVMDSERAMVELFQY